MNTTRRLGWWLAVAAGGAFGTLVRYEVTQAFPTERGAYPWAVLGVNVAGCLGAGAVMAVLHARLGVPDWGRALLVIGVCGGLTTFSTLVVNDVLLVRDDATTLAVLDLVGSLASGALAVWAAYRVVVLMLGGHAAGELDVREAD